jgi:hypothetical protein
VVFALAALLAGLLVADPAGLGTKPASDRTTRNIEEIEEGDLVLSRDPETGEVAYKRVVEVFRRTSDHLRILTVRDPDGGEQEFSTTDEHPFWVPQTGWVKAGELRLGQHVEQDDGQLATVVATAYEPHPEGVTVYNFEVDDFHTYFVAQAGGIRGPPVLVHNAQYRRQNGQFGGRIGRPPKPPAPSAHGNTRSSAPATLYAKFDKKGKFLKWGITQHADPCKRYTAAEIAGGRVVRIDRGPRNTILDTERYLVERIPGRDNHEPWAGTKPPNAPP